MAAVSSLPAVDAILVAGLVHTLASAFSIHAVYASQSRSEYSSNSNNSDNNNDNNSCNSSNSCIINYNNNDLKLFRLPPLVYTTYGACTVLVATVPLHATFFISVEADEAKLKGQARKGQGCQLHIVKLLIEQGAA